MELLRMAVRDQIILLAMDQKRRDPDILNLLYVVKAVLNQVLEHVASLVLCDTSD